MDELIVKKRLFKHARDVVDRTYKIFKYYSYGDIISMTTIKEKSYFDWLEKCANALYSVMSHSSNLPPEFTYPNDKVLNQNIHYSYNLFRKNKRDNSVKSRGNIAEAIEYLVINTLEYLHDIYNMRYIQIKKIKNESERLGIN